MKLMATLQSSFDFSSADIANPDCYWVDEDIEELRQFVLHKTIDVILDGRSSLDVRTEAVEWILDESIHPFSFDVCCRFGVHVDPEIFRRLVLRHIQKVNSAVGH